jgi:hypothetical protein
MTIDAIDLEASRARLKKILSGELTPENNRMYFEEDGATFDAATLDDCDPSWLLAEARDRRHPVAGRRNLVMYLVRFQAELWRELQAEDPTMPPYPLTRPPERS